MPTLLRANLQERIALSIHNNQPNCLKNLLQDKKIDAIFIENNLRIMRFLATQIKSHACLRILKLFFSIHENLQNAPSRFNDIYAVRFQKTLHRAFSNNWHNLIKNHITANIAQTYQHLAWAVRVNQRQYFRVFWELFLSTEHRLAQRVANKLKRRIRERGDTSMKSYFLIASAPHLGIKCNSIPPLAENPENHANNPTILENEAVHTR